MEDHTPIKQVMKSDLVVAILNANKARFTPRQYRLLMLVAEHGDSYRRDLEALDAELHYLPALNQKVSGKLASIGLEIGSRPAMDGSHRKKYTLREVRHDHAKAVRIACDAFGYRLYAAGGDDE